MSGCCGATCPTGGTARGPPRRTRQYGTQRGETGVEPVPGQDDEDGGEGEGEQHPDSEGSGRVQRRGLIRKGLRSGGEAVREAAEVGAGGDAGASVPQASDAPAKPRYVMARIGTALTVLGFLFQLAATITRGMAARARIRTFGQRYGPTAWIVARDRTKGERVA
mgnify:CR=1 FL=1